MIRRTPWNTIIIDLAEGMFEERFSMSKDPSEERDTENTVANNDTLSETSSTNYEDPSIDKNTLNLTQEWLDRLCASVTKIPYGIRWICKQLKSLLKVSVFDHH